MTCRKVTDIVTASVFVSAVFLSAAAVGQKVGPQRGVVGMVTQLRDKKVQQELNLSDNQVEQAKKIAAMLGQVRDGKAQDQAKRQLSASLNAGQLERLKQIHGRTWTDTRYSSRKSLPHSESRRTRKRNSSPPKR